METKININKRQTRSKRKAQNITKNIEDTFSPLALHNVVFGRRKAENQNMNSSRSKKEEEEKDNQHEAREEETRQAREDE